MTTRPHIPSAGVNYLRRVVLDNMLDQIRVITPAAPVYSPSTGYAVGTIRAVGYIGQAHIHQTDPSAALGMGDGSEPMAVISVTVPYDITPIPSNEDRVEIVSLGAESDSSLAGETLRIINVSGGGIGFVTRTLTCTFQQAGPFDPGA